MKINSYYPVIMVDEVKELSIFFQKYFGFKITFESDWYISLINKNNNEIAFLNKNHSTIPNGFGTKISGLLLNFEIDDIDSVYKNFKKELQSRIVLDLKDEDFGQRHFIVEGPEKVLIDIIQVIEPSDEYKENYE